MSHSLAQMFLDAQARVRSAPADLAARSVLWQIFALRGEFDRARAQLDMILKLDADWALEVQGCHALLNAEQQRSNVFLAQEPPVCLGSPPPWFGALATGIAHVARGQRESAIRLFTHVLEAAEPCTGTVDGSRFEWICDGDARLGPCLEILAQGRYMWVEIRSIQGLKCAQPEELRDLIWQPAKLEIDNSGATDVFLPARYPGGTADEHQLARTTDWELMGADLYLGHGQKCLSTDVDMHALLDIRELRIDH